MNRLPWRKIAWPLFGLFLLGAFVAITVTVVHMAAHASAGARLLAAGGWVAAFVVSWLAFRRSHGDIQPAQQPERGRSVKQQRWGVALGVAAVGILLELGGSPQMIGLALLSGFMWPAFFWIIHSFVRRPELRQRLWTGQIHS